MQTVVRFLFIGILGCAFTQQSAAQRLQLQNDVYLLSVSSRLSAKSRIEIQHRGQSELRQFISPTFTIFSSPADPQLKKGGIREGSSPVCGWGEKIRRVLHSLYRNQRPSARNTRFHVSALDLVLEAFPSGNSTCFSGLCHYCRYVYQLPF